MPPFYYSNKTSCGVLKITWFVFITAWMLLTWFFSFSKNGLNLKATTILASTSLKNYDESIVKNGSSLCIYFGKVWFSNFNSCVYDGLILILFFELSFEI